MPSRTPAQGIASGPLAPAAGRGRWAGKGGPPHPIQVSSREGPFRGPLPPFLWRAAHKMRGLQGRVKGARGSEREIPAEGRGCLLFARPRLTPGTAGGGQVLAAQTGAPVAGVFRASPSHRARGGRVGRVPGPPRRAAPLRSLRSSAPARLKPEPGPRSRGANSWKVPGKRPPPQRPGGALGARTEEGGGERRRCVGPGRRAHSSLRGPAFNSCQVRPPPRRLAGPGLPLKHEPPRPPPLAQRGPRTVRTRAPGAAPQDPRCPPWRRRRRRRSSGRGRRQVLVRGARRLRPSWVAGEGTAGPPRAPGGLGFRSVEPPGAESPSRGSAPPPPGTAAGSLRFRPGVGQAPECFFFFFSPKPPSK